MKISSHEPVSSQKYENGYRTKICDFTSVRSMYSFQFPLALTVALYTSDVVKHLPLSGHTSFLRQLHCRSSSFFAEGFQLLLLSTRWVCDWMIWAMFGMQL